MFATKKENLHYCEKAMDYQKGMKVNVKTLEELAKYIETDAVEIIDAVFVDPLGVWHHCSFCPSLCSLKDLKKGFAFDGSSIKLFTTVEKSDMMMMPDPTTCWIDPFCKRKTLHVGCNVEDCLGNAYDRCPRSLATRAVDHVKKLGIADTIVFGPEPEFFIFDDVKYAVQPNKMLVELDCIEGFWQSGLPGNTAAGAGSCDTNLGHRMGPKGYYFPVAPIDTSMNLRSEMLLTMKDIGLDSEKHHHEVATGQGECGFACEDLVTTADYVMAYKYVVKNVARIHGKSATFMPKPLMGDNGTGMHCHQSLWKDGKNLFYDENGKYFELSTMAMHYMGGLLKHAHAVLAISNPTVNSYKRLVPGFEAPANLVFSKGNRSAAIRIPLSADEPKTKRIEFRCSDAACCPYLAFAAMVMAGIDGIVNKTEPPPACDVDIYELPAEELKKIASTPANLEEALDALETDHEFLTRGGVFSEGYIKAYIAHKRAEAKVCSMIPNPKEFELYYHC